MMLHEHCAPRGCVSPLNTREKPGSRRNSSGKTEHFSSSGRLSPGIEPGQTRLLRSRGPSSDEVIRLAQQGDAKAFAHIYRLHSPRVYALCLRLVRDPAEAEDFTQEVFLQLFRKIHTFRGEAAFSSWLYRLAANLVFMTFRKKKLTMSSLESPSECDDEMSSTQLQVGATDLRLSGLFDRVNLQAALKQLPEGYRAMFVLYDVHGYEHHEIARMLGCSVGNSKSQLHKARKRLREVLRGQDLAPNKCGLVRRKDQRHSDGATNNGKGPEAVVSQKECALRS
jgi:RNA polymerase sigma-70 factor, ECF subfamily